MLDLIKICSTDLLLRFYLTLDNVSVRLMPLALYMRLAPAYDRVYWFAVALAPYDIPPIYEGVTDAFEYGD